MSAAQAQPWPTKSIRLIVPHAPGGVTDVVARMVSQPLAEALCQTIVVDNRPGAAGLLGTEVAAKTVPDPMSTLDLAQTFCDYAGTTLPESVHSRSLRPLVETSTATRDFGLLRWDLRTSRCGVGLALRTVLTKTNQLKLEKNSGAGELYDLAEDSYEVSNRSGDPVYAKVQCELMDMIAKRPDDACAPLPQIGTA